jgi:hypothetical protein
MMITRTIFKLESLTLRGVKTHFLHVSLMLLRTFVVTWMLFATFANLLEGLGLNFHRFARHHLTIDLIVRIACPPSFLTTYFLE